VRRFSLRFAVQSTAKGVNLTESTVSRENSRCRDGNPRAEPYFGRIAACRTRARISAPQTRHAAPRFGSVRSGDALRHIYFPTDAIVSLLYVLENGSSAEICVVGNDGVIGVSLFMGGETTTSRAIVQSAGSAYV